MTDARRNQRPSLPIHASHVHGLPTYPPSLAEGQPHGFAVPWSMGGGFTRGTVPPLEAPRQPSMGVPARLRRWFQNFVR